MRAARRIFCPDLDATMQDRTREKIGGVSRAGRIGAVVAGPTRVVGGPRPRRAHSDPQPPNLCPYRSRSIAISAPWCIISVLLQHHAASRTPTFPSARTRRAAHIRPRPARARPSVQCCNTPVELDRCACRFPGGIRVFAESIADLAEMLGDPDASNSTTTWGMLHACRHGCPIRRGVSEVDGELHEPAAIGVVPVPARAHVPGARDRLPRYSWSVSPPAAPAGCASATQLSARQVVQSDPEY